MIVCVVTTGTLACQGFNTYNGSDSLMRIYYTIHDECQDK